MQLQDQRSLAVALVLVSSCTPVSMLTLDRVSVRQGNEDGKGFVDEIVCWLQDGEHLSPLRISSGTMIVSKGLGKFILIQHAISILTTVS